MSAGGTEIAGFGAAVLADKAKVIHGRAGRPHERQA